MPPEQDQSLSLDSSNIFSEKNGKIFIGGEEIKPELRKLLKEQAHYLASSQLFELLINTAKNEAIKMGFHDSKEWNHTLSGKALWYYSKIFEKMVNTLKQ